MDVELAGMAIDPDAAYRDWFTRFEGHLGMIPDLLGVAVTLATPDTGVSRGGTRFDRPQVTGGGYHNEAPTVDVGPAADADALWADLVAYTVAVGGALEADTSIPVRRPGTPRAAKDTALIVVGSLVAHAQSIWERTAFHEFEETMFSRIRKLQRRHLPKWDGLPQHARDCLESCGGVRTVRAVYVDAENGSPRPVLVAKCTACGKTYTDANEAAGGTP